MSIKYNFTPRNTIEIECGDEFIEVLLPGLPAPRAPAPGATTPNPDPDHGRGTPVATTPIPPRPQQSPGVLAIISDKKRGPLDFDWTRFDPSVHVHSLERIDDMADDELARFLSQDGSQLDITANGLKIVNVGVTPWSGTTPRQLENLRRIVESTSIDVDAVRLIRLPDGD